MTERKVELRVDGGVGVIEMNNPPANSYTLEVLQDLDRAVVEARMDESVHVIVVRGAGDRFFSAGADINMLAGSSTEFRYLFSVFGHETLVRLENTPKLSIAAVNGHAIGGGLEVAMAADLRIAKKNAGRVGLGEVNLGVIPGMGGTQRLPRLVGRSRALELAASGRQIPFEEAHEMGLVNELYEGDDFFEQVMDYARQFVPPNKASLAVGRIKRAVTQGFDASLSEGLALEREVLYHAFKSEDAAEGLRAYRERQTPRFQGR